MARTQFPLTRKEFLDQAKPVNVSFDGQQVALMIPRQFNSGAVGWNGNGKTVLMVGDTPVQVQISLNVIGIGSKHAEDGATPAKGKGKKAPASA